MPNSVILDKNGNIHKFTKKRTKKRKGMLNKTEQRELRQRNSDKMFQECTNANPRSSTSNKGYEALGIYKGARIMKAEQKDPEQHTKVMEIIYASPVTRGANPQFTTRNEKQAKS